MKCEDKYDAHPPNAVPNNGCDDVDESQRLIMATAKHQTLNNINYSTKIHI